MIAQQPKQTFSLLAVLLFATVLACACNNAAEETKEPVTDTTMSPPPVVDTMQVDTMKVDTAKMDTGVIIKKPVKTTND